MKISLTPISKTFKLSIDPSGEATVTLRQANTGDVIRLGNLFADQTRIFDDDQGNTVKLSQKWNPEELKRERIMLTLVGIDLEDEDTSEPLFRFKDGKHGPELAMSRVEFQRAWGDLPPELAEEIYTYVIVVNPQWNPAFEGE